MASSLFQSKIFRLAAIGLGLLLLLLLIGPYIFTLNRYRPVIVEQLEKATGRDIEIETVRLQFLPRLAVHVGNFQVKNPRDFPAGDTLSVESINIGVALLPLLGRRVEVTSITVQGVKANLLQNELGRTNYEMPAQPPRTPRGRKPAAAEESLVSLTHIGAVALEDITVSSGSFWSRQKRIYPGWTATGINLEVGGFDLTDPKWLGKLRAEMDLSSIEVSSPALKEPLRFTDGDVEVKDNTAAGDFELALGSLGANGTVKVADLERPVADFTLAMKELNAGELNKVVGGGAKGGPSGRAGGRQLLARGTVRVDRVIVPPISAQNVQGKARLYADRLEVDPFSLELYGGKSHGTLGVDLVAESMPARVNARVEGVNVAQAVAAASPQAKGKLTGTFEADALLGAALGAGDPMAGLSGNGTFAVRDGTFPGLNLEGTLAGMAKFMQMDVPKGDTRFSYFGGDFRIANQRVHSSNLDLQAETLKASLGGSFGFDQTLNYSGSGVLTGKSSQQQQEQQSSSPLGGLGRVFGKVMQQTIGRMRVPFTVRGTFQQPQFVLAGSPAPVQ